MFTKDIIPGDWVHTFECVENFYWYTHYWEDGWWEVTNIINGGIQCKLLKEPYSFCNVSRNAIDERIGDRPMVMCD